MPPFSIIILFPSSFYSFPSFLSLSHHVFPLFSFFFPSTLVFFLPFPPEASWTQTSLYFMSSALQLSSRERWLSNHVIIVGTGKQNSTSFRKPGLLFICQLKHIDRFISASERNACFVTSTFQSEFSVVAAGSPSFVSRWISRNPMPRKTVTNHTFWRRCCEFSGEGVQGVHLQRCSGVQSSPQQLGS